MATVREGNKSVMVVVDVQVGVMNRPGTRSIIGNISRNERARWAVPVIGSNTQQELRRIGSVAVGPEPCRHA
jgi:hypothetical protein